MSIIHDALRRKEAQASGIISPLPQAGGAAEPRKSAQFLPAALAVAGVFATALLTFLLTRPSTITVIVPSSEPASVAQPAVSSAAPPPPDLLTFEPLREEIWTTPPNTTSPQAPRPAPPTFVERLPAAINEEDIPIAPDFRSIPVYAGTRLQAPDADLPPDAVTIEMSEATLESMNGGVTVNGLSVSPGSRIQVGSEIRTGAGAAASIGFTRASVDLTAGSAGKIMRLERRSTSSGAPAEDVTLHLSSGSVRTVVRPGGGSMLVSTDPLTAATNSGAFQLTREANGDVRVRNEGGSVKLIPTARPDEAIHLGAGEEIIYRDGAWIRKNP